MEKPTVNLTDCDGNVFAIIGRVSGALKRAGDREGAAKFSSDAMKCDSYDEVLQLCFAVADVA